MNADAADGASKPQLGRDDPWPGLDSYSEASRDFFSGRATEIDELVRRVLDESVTVLFGKSGLGKTSLLRAGLFPRLREKGYLPIYVRLHVHPDGPPLLEQLRLALADELTAQQIDHPAWEPDESLWEYLHRAGLEFWTRQNQLVRPVFVFDQFEELFTLGRAMPAEVERFREALADLSENRIPASLARRLEAGAVSDQQHDRQARIYKVLVSLREDFLADLEGWRVIMPSLRRNRMRLLPMGPNQALQAVCNERTSHVVSEPIARKIVAFLSSRTGPGPAPSNREGTDALSTEALTADDPFAEGCGATVEPALLSLFCRGVNEHRKRDGKREFDDALLEGAQETIVVDFYRTSLQDQPERVKRFIEEELITEHGFRNSYSVDDALAHGFVTPVELDALVNRRLLRREHHLGAERVELTHDLLTKAVLEERARRRTAERLVKDSRQRWRLRAAVVVALVFLAVAVSAWRSAQRAEDLAEQADNEARRAKSRELAARARNVVDEDPEVSVLLALTAIGEADTWEARSALWAAARYAWPVAQLDREKLGGIPEAVALSADGSRLAVLAKEDEGKKVTLWDVTVRTPVMVWDHPLVVNDAVSVAISPDQRRIAVGRTDTIDIVDPQDLGKRTRVGDLVSEANNLAFSPEGDWLAVIQRDGEPDATIRMWDVRSDPPVEQTPAADCAGVRAVALLPDAKEIICVSDPLAAQRMERNGMRWIGKPLNFDECTKPDSISPGVLHSSMTLKARTCIVGQSEPVNESGAINDILWSVKGGAFVECLESHDVLVASGDPKGSRSTNRIKGSRPRLNSQNKAPEISVSDDGRRLAILSDRADGQRGGRSTEVVRIYSLAEHKPLLSRLDGNVVVAPDGRWVARRTYPLTETEDPPSNSTRIEVIALDEWLASTDARPVGREEATANEKLEFAPVRSIDVPPPGSNITMLAARDAIILVSEQPPRTVVYDVTSGKEKFPPLDGQAQLLGSDGALLLVQLRSEGDSPDTARVMRTRDGSEVVRWAVAPPPYGVLVSEHHQAIAVTQTGSSAGVLLEQQSGAPASFQPQLIRPAPPGQQCGVRNVTVYAAAGDRLVPSGELKGIPDDSWIEVADHARSVTVKYRIPRAQRGQPMRRVCTMSATASTDASSCTQPDPSGDSQQDSLLSPRGKFAVAHRGERVQIVRRRDEHRDEHVLRDFDNTNFNENMTQFSEDDQWVVVQPNKSSLNILKLNDEGDTAELSYAFDLTDQPESAPVAETIDKVGFEGDARLLKITFGNADTMLVPLDPIPFARWLVPRNLTNPEQCEYWRDGPACRN